MSQYSLVFLLLVLMLSICGCDESTDSGEAAGNDPDTSSDDLDTDADTDSDTDSDADTDTDSDTDTDADTDADTDTDVSDHEPMTDCDGGKYDPASNLCWMDPEYGEPLVFDEAVATCDSLSLGDHDDWRLPTISELRSLFRAGTDALCLSVEWDMSWDAAPDGTCELYDGCLSSSACYDTDLCYPDVWPGTGGPGDSGTHWDSALSGSNGILWSSSPVEGSAEERAWLCTFDAGCFVGSNAKTTATRFRCVREGN